MRGAEGTGGKRVAAGRLVREFDALAVVREDDGVVADDIAAADGVDADFVLRAFADDALTAMTKRFFKLQFAHVGKNFEQRRRRAARRVFLEAMVHLDDF